MRLNLGNVFNNDGEVIVIDHTADYSNYENNGVFPMRTPVKITGKVENKAGVVTLTAEADFVYSAPCDRCAAITDRQMHVPIRHSLVTSLNDEENDEFMLLEDAVLDVDELVFTDILLELPSKYLCSEACKGLCMQCGKNLNEGPCDCKRPVDPRLAVLKQLLEE